jgi:uncharacterized protein
VAVSRTIVAFVRHHSIKGDEMAGKFELFTDKSGEIRWHLQACNGEIIASSQGDKSKAAAEKGIDSVKAKRAWRHGGRQHRLAARPASRLPHPTATTAVR